MGGSGSGSWCRWDKRTTCEEIRRIDIRYMRKLGLLHGSGSLSWSSRGEPTGAVGYTITGSTMTLSFRCRRNGGEWEDVKQANLIDQSPFLAEAV